MKNLKMVVLMLMAMGVFLGGVVIWDGTFMKTMYDVSADRYDEEKELM